MATAIQSGAAASPVRTPAPPPEPSRSPSSPTARRSTRSSPPCTPPSATGPSTSRTGTACGPALPGPGDRRPAETRRRRGVHGSRRRRLRGAHPQVHRGPQGEGRAARLHRARDRPARELLRQRLPGLLDLRDRARPGRPDALCPRRPQHPARQRRTPVVDRRARLGHRTARQPDSDGGDAVTPTKKVSRADRTSRRSRLGASAARRAAHAAAAHAAPGSSRRDSTVIGNSHGRRAQNTDIESSSRPDAARSATRQRGRRPLPPAAAPTDTSSVDAIVAALYASV